MKPHGSLSVRIAILACLTVAATAPLAAQDLTITNARIIGRQRHRDRARIDRRPRREDRRPCRRGAVRLERPDHRRQRHDCDAGLHRRAPPHQHRPQREGADAGAARSRLHDHPLGRRPGGRQHHAPGSHRVGPDQRSADHPVRRPAAEPAHAGIGSRRDPEDGGHGRQVHRRDRAHARARPDRDRRWTSSGRSSTRARRPA